MKGRETFYRRRNTVPLNSSYEVKYVIIPAGDFNYPDIDWGNATVRKGAADREVQQALLDLSIEPCLIQIHDKPKR